MAEYDIIIRGGTVVDGTRTPRYVSDVAITDGKIARIGGLRASDADRVLDASGLIVAPGFVDLHTHYDAQIQWDPHCSVSGWHGVTSVAIGNCGFGFAPVDAKDQERSMLALTRNEAIPLKAMEAGMLWDWVTFPEFLDTMDRIPKGVNVLSYVPLTPIYGWVMGWDEAKKRRPTEAELREMCRLVDEGMDAGACGWSAQVTGPTSIQRDYDGTPMITDLMTNEEILAFARVLRERDEGFIELAYREPGEGEKPLEEANMEFFERVAEAAGRPVLYQVVNANVNDPEVYRKRLRWLEECTGRGLRVYGQGDTRRTGRELTFEDWNLFDRNPVWREVTLGSLAERKGKMQDPDLRRRLREDWDAGDRPGTDVMLATGSLAGLMVGEVGRVDFEHYVGKKVGDIAAEEEKHVVDALLDMVVADGLQTEFITSNDIGSPEFSAEIMKSPHVISGLSDGGAHVKFPQGGGVFTTSLLQWLVRDKGVLSLEEAHYKLSYLPAFLGGFQDRGYLREGAPADVVIYDLENLEVLPSEVARDLPGGEWRRVQRSAGYRWILVNGRVTLEDGKPTGTLPGKLLRHGRG